jgi:hypothetical protein
MRAIRLGLLILVSGGCAHTSFYSDPALQRETGFAYYAPKPYLLVERTGADKQPVEVRVVYLPDFGRVQYVKHHPGLGSAEMSLTLSNGIVTALGQQADSEVADTLDAVARLTTSVGGLTEALAEAAKTRIEAAGLREEAVSMGRRLEAAALLASVGDVLAEHYLGSSAPTPSQTALAKDNASRLETARRRLEDPQEIRPETGAVALVEEALETWSRLQVSTSALKAKLVVSERDLRRVVELLTPASAAAPDFELFEIVEAQGRTVLLPVQVREP